MQVRTLLSTLALVLMLPGFMATGSVLAQDGGTAPFDIAAQVGVGVEYMGSANGADDGVIQLAPVVTGSGGYVYYTVTVSAAGKLNFWIDTDNDGDFEDEVEQDVSVLAGANHVEVAIYGAIATSPSTTWIRFIYEDGTNLVSDPNTNYSATVNGEIEDHPLEILPVGSDVTVNLTAGGGQVSREGINFVVIDGLVGGNRIFESVALNINDIRVEGGGGDDNIKVDWDLVTATAGTITIDGNGEGAEDTFQMVYDVPWSLGALSHTFLAFETGFVTASDVTIYYEDIEFVDDMMDVEARTYTFPATNDDITLDNFDGPSDDRNVVDSGTTDEQWFSIKETTSIIVNAGDGDDTITVGLLDTGLTGASVTVNGNDGEDYFDVQPGPGYTVHANGNDPTVLTAGDQFTLNVASVPSDEHVTLVEDTINKGAYSFAKKLGGASLLQPVSYNTMEQVTLRFSDPTAFQGELFEGDWLYPLSGESGISIEPYFNWDIDLNQALPGPHPTRFGSLSLVVSESADLSNPVFTTTTKEDGTPLVDSPAGHDHYITDLDRDAGIVLDNNETYWWELKAEMAAGQTFSQLSWFKTVDAAKPDLDYPAENLTLYNRDVIFNWNTNSQVADEMYWRMELDDVEAGSFVGYDPYFPNSLLMGDGADDDELTAAFGFAADTEFDSDDLPNPLAWGTTYSWRVATMWPVPPTGWVPQEIHDKHETDRLVGVSEVEQFKTVAKAVPPVLTYPVGGLTIHTNTPILSWNVQGPFAELIFNLSITELGGADACEPGGFIGSITGIQFDTANCSMPLIPGKTYEWSIAADDGTNFELSTSETFSIVGAGVAKEATLSYPVGDLEIYTSAPTFHWYTESDASGLSFVAWYKERGGPAAGSCADVQSGGTSLPSVSVTQVDVGGLTPGATYDWCVVTTGLNGSVDSGVDSFSVAGGAGDGKPIASWPVGNPTGYTLDQVLTWYVEGASLGITDYTVEVCVAPDTFGDPGCTTATGLTTPTYEVNGLVYGDVVIWRVKASYTSGPDSDWNDPSAQGSFTVTGNLSSLMAELTNPVGNQIIYDTTANLGWYVTGAAMPANSMVYEVQWSYASTFPSIGSVTQSVVTATNYHDVAGLIPGHTYWWRVRISVDNGASFGTWSQAESFDVAAGANAVMPRVGSPTRSVTVATNSPVLSWVLPTQSTSTLTYDLHVGQQPDLSDATVLTGIAATHHRLSDLEAGRYFWAVRSHASDGTTSALSSIGTFVSGGSFATNTDELDGREVLPEGWSLGQNYPNPFNPTTTIEFTMPQSAGVTVRVYNVLGQVVKTLVNGTLPSGTHQVRWDATDNSGAGVSSGLYVYRMETEAFQATKTLVLMK